MHPPLRHAQGIGGAAPDTPPLIYSVTASPNILWPANHQLEEVSVTVRVIDDVDDAPAIVVEATDFSGNSARETVDVRVPHDNADPGTVAPPAKPAPRRSVGRR